MRTRWPLPPPPPPPPPLCEHHILRPHRGPGGGVRCRGLGTWAAWLRRTQPHRPHPWLLWCQQGVASEVHLVHTCWHCGSTTFAILTGGQGGWRGVHHRGLGACVAWSRCAQPHRPHPRLLWRCVACRVRLGMVMRCACDWRGNSVKHTHTSCTKT